MYGHQVQKQSINTKTSSQISAASLDWTSGVWPRLSTSLKEVSGGCERQKVTGERGRERGQETDG